MTITAATIKAMPAASRDGFADLSDDTVDTYITRAASRMDSAYWGTRYDDAHLYLSAHLLYLDVNGAGAPSGPITSASAGGMSLGFGSPAADSWLAATHYGRQYLQMMRENRQTPVVC